ncbi:MAG: zinc ribbon domain-containing protein [Gaiellaceae bacterium]
MYCLNCGHDIDADARFCARCGAPQTGASTRELSATRPARLLGNPYVRAVKRYWWVLVLGVGVALVAAIAAVYRIDLASVPPTLEKREQITYTSSARLLVTSAEAPYFRTTVPRVSESPATGEGQEPSSTTFLTAPDLGTLISTANLYPILVESDEVAQIRQEMAGPLPGTVTSRAIYEVNSPSRFELSQVPVLEIYGSSDTYGGAVKLTEATVSAFLAYMDDTQDEASLDRDERILLQQIQRPAGAVASGGASLSLPLMLFVVISAAFVGLAILLDRLFPFGLLPALRWRAAPEPAGGAELGEAGSEPERARRSKAQV